MGRVEAPLRWLLATFTLITGGNEQTDQVRRGILQMAGVWVSIRTQD